ncbi:hypothetical protein, partial [Methanogenium cariaci]
MRETGIHKNREKVKQAIFPEVNHRQRNERFRSPVDLFFSKTPAANTITHALLYIIYRTEWFFIAGKVSRTRALALLYNSYRTDFSLF